MDRILPTILVLLTGQDRYLPDIEWSSNSWTHNMFRFYESLFWRRVGIRAEITTKFDGIKAIHQAHSFEGACALIETSIRQFFEFAIPIKIWIPLLSTPEGLPKPASPFLFAIAFDTSLYGGDATSSYSYTVTGSNPILIGQTYDRNFGISAVSYNSVAMTNSLTQADGSSGGEMRAWKLGAPATGAHTVSITTGGSTAFGSIIASYSGAAATLDSTNVGSATSGGTKAISTTVVAASSWLIGMAGTFGSGGTVTSNQASTRQTNSTFFTGYSMCYSDSNTTVSTGSNSITFTNGNSPSWAVMALSISPFVANTSITFITSRPPWRS